jgi:hypothetical protein
MESVMQHTNKMLLCKVEDLASLPYMVRRYSAGQVEELAALIASPGLLQNPIVTEQVGGRGKRRQTKFGVVAGEQRRALVLLQERQVLAPEHEVLCELVSAGHAVEIGLAESSWREAMHRADELFEAFHAMVARGQGIKDVTARFFERFGLQARSTLQITARPPRHELLRTAHDMPAGRVRADLGSRRAVWIERPPQAEGEWLDWLVASSQPELLNLLGLCAVSLERVPTGLASAAIVLERLAGLDMREWWEPTPEAFLKHVPKGQIAQALKEEGAGSEVSAATGMKKGRLAALAATKLAGKGWLPEPLRAVACT